MSPTTHLLISWSIANTANVYRRERALVTLAGVIPDFDGAGLFLDIFQQGSEQPFHLWSKYHHILGHNIGFCFFLIVVSLVLSTKRLTSGLLVFISCHLHLVCDLLGSKGSDGFQWPIPYWLPFSNAWQLTWDPPPVATQCMAKFCDYHRCNFIYTLPRL